MNSKHWVMYNGTPTSILSPLTFELMADTYGKDYLGEECNVTGKLTANLASFVMLEQPSNLTTGETMYDPIHEEVFGESNLADSHVPSTASGKPSVWTDLLGAIEILTEHFQSELSPTITERTKSIAGRVEDLMTPQAAQVCSEANCAFCTKPAPTEELTLTPRKRSDIERLLYNAEIQYPESEEFIVVRGGYFGSVEEFLDSMLIKPTVEEYREAAAGNRPFPINAVVSDSLATALATLPEIKGVNLKDSTTYRGVMNEAKDLLNDPTAHGKAIVDSILALLGIEDTVRNLPDQVNPPEPKAKRFVITRDPADVFSVFKLFMANTEAQASREASVSRSPDINRAIYNESVESLKKRTYIAFGDLMDLPRLPLAYIADNAEANVFNLSAQGKDFVQNICTIRYNKFEYTIEVFR